jgi:predicted nucleotide-binding protein (sugar kinase/HSP70/actin superfamily)
VPEKLAIEKAPDVIAVGELLVRTSALANKTPATANDNNAPEHCINLFKEGIFWRVYQKSAYAFTQQIKNLKVMKKLFKIVN